MRQRQGHEARSQGKHESECKKKPMRVTSGANSPQLWCMVYERFSHIEHRTEGLGVFAEIGSPALRDTDDSSLQDPTSRR